jgi:hypothetical protein
LKKYLKELKTKGIGYQVRRVKESMKEEIVMFIEKEKGIQFVVIDSMVTVLFSRALMSPIYLAQLGLIQPLNETIVKTFKNSSFAIMAFALLLGAFIVLRAMWRGRRAERELVEQEAVEHI